jgi:hypothetical protein
MNKSLLFKLFTLLTVAAVLCSCHKKDYPSNLTVIPQNASMVLMVNVDSLMAKADIKSLKESPLYSIIHDDLLSSQTTLRTALDNPEKTGIAFHQIFGFMTDKKATAISLELKDDDDFLDFVKQVIKNENLPNTILKAKDFYLASLDNEEKAFLVWDEDKALIIKNTTKADALGIFKTQKDSCILQDKDFADAYKTRKEVSVWAKTDKLYSLISEKNPYPFVSLPEEGTAGTFCHLNLQFIPGEIKITNTITPVDSAKKMNERLFNSQAECRMLSYLPQKTLLLLKTSISKQTIEQKLGPDEDLSEILTPQQISAIHAWNGDVVAAILNTNQYSLPQVVLGISVANNTVSECLLKDIYGHYPKKQMNGYTAISQQGFTLYTAQKGNQLIVTNNEPTIQAFARNKAIANNAYSNTDIKNSPTYFYLNLDFNSYPMMLKSYFTAFGLGDRFNAAMLFKDIQIKTNKDSGSSTYQIRLKETDKNSLAVLFSKLGQITN